MTARQNNKDTESLPQWYKEAINLINTGDYKEGSRYLEKITSQEYAVLEDHILVLEAKSLLDKIRHQRQIIRFRKVFLITLILTLLTIFILLSCRVSFALIEARLHADEFTFRLANAWVFSSEELSSLDLLVPNELNIDVAEVEIRNKKTDDNWESIENSGMLNLLKQSGFFNVFMHSNYLKVSSFNLDSGAVVRISYKKNPANQIIISVLRGNAVITIESGDTLYLNCNNSNIKTSSETLNLNNYELRVKPLFGEIQLKNDGHDFEAVLQRTGHYSYTDNPISHLVSVDSICFTRFYGEFEESTIKDSSKIFIPDLGRGYIAFKEGDIVQMQNLKQFYIRNIRARETLEVILEGKVGTINSGIQSRLTSIKPTLLEWLYNNQTFALFIGTLVPVFTILLAGIKRLSLFQKT